MNVRVQVVEDEWWPVYEPRRCVRRVLGPWDAPMEIPRELYVRARRTEREFRKVQDELEKFLDNHPNVV